KSLRTQRQHIRDLLEESPSLRPHVAKLVQAAYPDAVNNAVDETGLPADRFPADCPYAPDDVLAEDYLPNDSF
ncbi:MAG: DUF29 domain-containing protein, partial [Geminicoccales bacterium]